MWMSTDAVMNIKVILIVDLWASRLSFNAAQSFLPGNAHCKFLIDLASEVRKQTFKLSDGAIAASKDCLSRASFKAGSTRARASSSSGHSLHVFLCVTHVISELSHFRVTSENALGKIGIAWDLRGKMSEGKCQRETTRTFELLNAAKQHGS